MRFNGRVDYVDGAKSYNLSIPAGNTFPTAPHTNGEFWILLSTNTEGRPAGLYVYNSTQAAWLLLLNDAQLGSVITITADNGATFPVNTIKSSDTVSLVNNADQTTTIQALRPKIQLSSTASIDINTAAEIAIPWQSELLTTPSMFTHSTVTNNHQITVLKAGVVRATYMVNYAVQGNNTTGSLKTYIKKNGTLYTPSTSYSWIDQGESIQGTNQCVVYIPVAANDVLVLYSIRNGKNPVMNLIPNEATFSLSWYVS